MEILNSPRIPIASVAMTRQLKQEEATVAKPAAAADAKASPDTTKTEAPTGKKIINNFILICPLYQGAFSFNLNKADVQKAKL